MSEEPMKYIDEQNPLHVLSTEIFKLFKEYREEWLKENAPDDLIWIFNGNEQAIVSYNINFKIPEYQTDDIVIDGDGNVVEGLGDVKELKKDIKEKLADFKKDNYEGLPKKLVRKLKNFDEKKADLMKNWKH